MNKFHDLKIAVTGASGYVGKRLTDHLLDLGCNVSILVRDEELLSYEDNTHLTVFQGDLSDINILVELVDNCDLVIHLAAYVHKPIVTHDQEIRCYETNYLGTKNLIDVCITKSPTIFFLFLSTVAVYGTVDGVKVENQECNPTTKYGETKLAAEKYLLSKITAGELRGSILRPSTIIGENAPGNLSRLIKLIDIGIIPSFNSGLNKKSMVDVYDVVMGIISIIENTQISNQQIFNIAYHTPIKLNEIIHIIGSALGKKPIVIHLPKGLVVFFSSLWDSFARLFKGKLPLLQRSIEVFTSDEVVNTNKIQEQLGYQPVVSITESVTRMVIEYNRN